MRARSALADDNGVFEGDFGEQLAYPVLGELLGVIGGGSPADHNPLGADFDCEIANAAAGIHPDMSLNFALEVEIMWLTHEVNSPVAES